MALMPATILLRVTCISFYFSNTTSPSSPALGKMTNSDENMSALTTSSSDVQPSENSGFINFLNIHIHYFACV